jgi:hypothetical protein
MVRIKQHYLKLIEGKKIYFGRKKLKYDEIKKWKKLPLSIKTLLMSQLNSDIIEVSLDTKNNVFIASKNKNINFLCKLQNDRSLKLIKKMNYDEYWIMITKIRGKIKNKISFQYYYYKKMIKYNNRPNTRNNISKKRNVIIKSSILTKTPVIKFL